MNVRNFDGIDDQIVTAIGTLDGLSFGTFVWLVKPAVGAGNRSAALGSVPNEWNLQFRGNGAFRWSVPDDGTSDSAGSFFTHGNWSLIVARKASGLSSPWISRYDLDTQTWSHTNITARQDYDDTETLTGTNFSGFASLYQGLIAARAVWRDSLPWSADTAGNSALELAGLEASASAWLDAEPDAFWLFDQDDASTAVEDITGNGADQDSITGTNVVTNDDPPGFSIDLSPETFDPANLDIAVDGTSAHLTWDPSPTPGVVGYSVFRREGHSGEPFDPDSDTPIATGVTNTEYSDENVSPGEHEWQVFGHISED